MVFHLLQQISKAPCQWRWRLAPTLALTLARKRGRRCHRLSCERSWYISVPHFSIPGRYRINNVHTPYIFWLFILCIIKYSLFVYILNHILIKNIYNTSWNIIYIYLQYLLSTHTFPYKATSITSLLKECIMKAMASRHLSLAAAELWSNLSTTPSAANDLCCGTRQWRKRSDLRHFASKQ